MTCAHLFTRTAFDALRGITNFNRYVRLYTAAISDITWWSNNNSLLV